MGSRSEKWHAAIWAALVAIGSIEVFVLLPTSLRTAAIFSLIGFGLYVAVSRSWIVLYPDFRQRGVGYLFATLAPRLVRAAAAVAPEQRSPFAQDTPGATP